MAVTEYIDYTAAKIVLAAKRGDSINRISNKVGTSYSWVYDWIDRLEDANIIARTDDGIQVTDHQLRRRYDELMAALYRRDRLSQEDAYIIPHFSGMEFAFNEIDAAYVWTKGGFQLSRSHDDYPVFIKVLDRDIDRWLGFFERYGIMTSVGERSPTSDGIYFVLYPTENDFTIEWSDGNPVIALEMAVEQMLEDRVNYEPALEILEEDYDIDVDAAHNDG